MRLGWLLSMLACDGRGRDLGVPVSLRQEGARECLRPDDRAIFGPYERNLSEETPRPSDPWIWHGGIIAADLDGDGHVDLVSALEQGVRIYQGVARGKPIPRGAGVFSNFDLSYASGGSAADYDGDGDLDLYITRVAGYPAPEGPTPLGGEYGVNRLLRNDGAWRFTDVTDAAGVAACGEDFRDGAQRCFKSMASSWGDYDSDGDLDLYVGNYGFVDETNGTLQTDMGPAERDFLYRNEGDGTFSDVSDLLPLQFHEGYTYAGGFHDLDGDGDLDLYTVNDFGVLYPNRVLWGDGRGSFAFVGGPPLSDGSQLDASQTGMGLGIGDLNGDGWLDLAIAEWKKNTLFLSLPEAGAWLDTADAADFALDARRQQEVGWGTLLGDVDNDGYLDILNQYGHLRSENISQWPNQIQQGDGLYLHRGTDEPSFVEMGVEWRVADPGWSRGAVLADLNEDGWLDIAKRSLDTNDVLYLSRCGEERWLTVALEQPGTLNVHAVGARVYAEAGDRVQMQPLVAGGVGYASSPPIVAHFGLGDADLVELRVVWPDGQESVVPLVGTRQRVVITRLQ